MIQSTEGNLPLLFLALLRFRLSNTFDFFNNCKIVPSLQCYNYSQVVKPIFVSFSTKNTLILTRSLTTHLMVRGTCYYV